MALHGVMPEGYEPRNAFITHVVESADCKTCKGTMTTHSLSELHTTGKYKLYYIPYLNLLVNDNI